MLVVAIEGVVGAGKTCALERLRQRGNPCIGEPVLEYTQFGKFNPLFLSYERPRVNAPIAQHHIIVQSTKYYKRELDLMRERFGGKSETVVYTERSVFSPEAFIGSLLIRDLTSDFVVEYLLRELQRLRCVDTVPDVIVWLECPLEECSRRVALRSRCEEQCCTIECNLSFLQAYEDYVLKSGRCPVIYVSPGDKASPEEVADLIEEGVSDWRRNTI